MKRILAYTGAFLVVFGAILLSAEGYSRQSVNSLSSVASKTNIGLEAVGVIFLAFGLSSIILASVRRGMPSPPQLSVKAEPAGESPAPMQTGKNEPTGGVSTAETGEGKDETPMPLSSLDLHLLRTLRYTKNKKELSRTTGVDVKVVSVKLGQLCERGYITENAGLTEKGYDAVNSSVSKPTGQRTVESSGSQTYQNRKPTTHVEQPGSNVGELGLGIILVLVSLPTLIYFGIVSSTPFVGAFFIQSYFDLAALMVLLLIIGAALLLHSQQN